MLRISSVALACALVASAPVSAGLKGPRIGIKSKATKTAPARTTYLRAVRPAKVWKWSVRGPEGQRAVLSNRQNLGDTPHASVVLSTRDGRAEIAFHAPGNPSLGSHSYRGGHMLLVNGHRVAFVKSLGPSVEGLSIRTDHFQGSSLILALPPAAVVKIPALHLVLQRFE